MIATPRPGNANSPATPSCRSTATFPPDVVRSWMRDRRILAGAGLVIGGSGVALGWDWLTAIGVTPLIVSAAPCLLMCAFGLCMIGRRRQANSGSAGTAPADPANPTDRE
jgi:hypothetical protein